MKRFPAAMLCAAALSACGRKPEPPREEPKKPAPVEVPVDAGGGSLTIPIRLHWPTMSLTLSPGESRSWIVVVGADDAGKASVVGVRVDGSIVAALERPPAVQANRDGISRAWDGLGMDPPDFVEREGRQFAVYRLRLSAPEGTLPGNFTGEISASDSRRVARLEFSVRVAPMEVRIREAMAGSTEPLERLPLGRLVASPGFERGGRAAVDFGGDPDAAEEQHVGRIVLNGSTLWDLGRLEALGPVVDTSKVPGFTALGLAGPPTRMKLLVFSHERVDFVDLANFPASRGFALPGDCAVSFGGDRVARISADGTQALACNAAGTLTWHRGLDAKEPPPAVTVLESGVENAWADAKFEHAVALFREADGKSTLKWFSIADPPQLRDLPGSLISIREAWFSPDSGFLLVAGPGPACNSAALYDVARGVMRAALPEPGWGHPEGFLRNSGLPVFSSKDGVFEWDATGGPPRQLSWTKVPDGFSLRGTEARFTVEGRTVRFARPK